MNLLWEIGSVICIVLACVAGLAIVLSMPSVRNKAHAKRDGFWIVWLNLVFAWNIAIQFLILALLFPIGIAKYTTGLDLTTYAANLLVAILIGASFVWLAINVVANARRICEKWSRSNHDRGPTA